MVPRTGSVGAVQPQLCSFPSEGGGGSELVQLQGGGHSCLPGTTSLLLQGSGNALLSGTTLILSSGGGVWQAWQQRSGELVAGSVKDRTCRREGRSESGGPCFIGREPGPKMELGSAVSSGADLLQLEARVRMPGECLQPYRVGGRKGDLESSPEK